jgi:hypothetical protein
MMSRRRGLSDEAKRLGTYWARSEGLAALVGRRGETESSVTGLEPGCNLLEQIVYILKRKPDM